MTQAEAAAAIGVNTHSVYRWEVGLRRIGASDRERLMAVYARATAERQGRQGGSVPHGTSGGSVGFTGAVGRVELAAVEPLLVRVERELLRLGAEDFEVDHLRHAVGCFLADRALHGHPVPRTVPEAEADGELARYVAVLRTWVRDGIAGRAAGGAPAGVTVGRRPGVRVDSASSATPAPEKPARRANDRRS